MGIIGVSATPDERHIMATTTINTHRATCEGCACEVILRPAPAQDHVARPVDALATVVRPTRETRALPVLPALVWWTCPSCDTYQRA